MPDMSPERWLEHLIAKLEARLPEMYRLLDYASGNAPLQEGATQYREAYAKWQKLSRTNFADLIIDAAAERIRIAGFRVGDEATDNDAARALWRRSAGGSCASDIHRDALTYGYGYGMAAQGRFGAVLTHESPFATITEHDPLDPTWVLAGLKMWSDLTNDHAVVHLPGEVWRFVRESSSLPDGMHVPLTGGWTLDPERSGPSGLDRVPIVQFTNRDGIGEFAKHTDLLDRINWVILQRLLIVGMQAFRQRALEESNPDGEGLPETDEDGDEIDWNEAFIPGPDALWVLPPGVKIWESQPGDIQQILTAAKDDIGQLAAVTRTPMSTFMPGDDSANQSAEGASFAREGLVFKAEDRIERFTPAWDVLESLGLRIDGIEADVQTQWAPAERQSLAERFDALTKAADLPWRRRMTDVLGYGADTVDVMELERAQDAVAASQSSGAQGGPRELSLAEVVQKVYLGVGKVLSAEEARQILADAGADIDPSAPVPAAV